MFDKFLIVENSLRPWEEAGEVKGFRFQARLGYYRGLTLSMVEALDISIDGQVVERSAVRLDEGKGWLSLDEMETAYDRRWGFGQAVEIGVLLPGGLAPGSHELSFSERLRVSYLPFPSINSDAKTLTLAA